MNSESLEDAYIRQGKFWFEKAWAWLFAISYTLPAKVSLVMVATSLGMVARVGGRDTYLKNYFYFESKTPEWNSFLSRWLWKKPAKLESEIIWWSLSSPVPGFMICIHFRASPLFFALLEVIFFYLITELARWEEVQEMEVNLMQTMQERGERFQLSQICAKIFLSSNVIQSVPTDPLKEYW